MARETLGVNSRFAAAFTTADDERVVFRMARSRRKRSGDQWRASLQLPEHRAALRRLGITFTGYGGYDGQVWTQVGQPETISMPAANRFWSLR